MSVRLLARFVWRLHLNSRPSTWFQKLLLPGLAFKAAVIGGGYATGRELATFFLPSGPHGGLYGMLLAMLIWSGVCMATFLFALQTGSRDYRTFFGHLLGPLWPLFELTYFLAIIVILAAFAAAAGAVGEALLGWPQLAGSLCLVGAIALIAVWGNEAVEGLFKYASFFLYATYIVFIVLALSRFGGHIEAVFSHDSAPTGWVSGGVMYAGYNMLGAIVILPVMRHITRPREALTAGLLAGPLTMIPGMLFFICMLGGYPEIGSQVLPSDYLLAKLDLPVFRAIFEVMIFAALLESATSGVHAVNERIATAYRRHSGDEISTAARLGITLVLLTGSVFVAARFGLVALIASGYRWIAYSILAFYVLPLMTLGVWRVWRTAKRRWGSTGSVTATVSHPS